MTKSMLGITEKACVNTSRNRPQRRMKQEGRSGSQIEPSELVRPGRKLGRRNTICFLSSLKERRETRRRIHGSWEEIRRWQEDEHQRRLFSWIRRNRWLDRKSG